MTAMRFIVARNPDANSTLPYLLGLPLNGRMLWLKGRETWPRASRVYCHRAQAPTDPLDIIESVQVVACNRRGAAIDLLLDRKQNKRSQFVCVAYRGRRMIFWQSAQSSHATRPGLRIPANRRAARPTLYVDTRERYAYSFGNYQTERRRLAVGDYAVIGEDGAVLAAVERKTFANFATSLNDGTLNLEMMELAHLPHAAVVVESLFAAVINHRYTTRGYLPDLTARLAIRYPSVPILFFENRKIAQHWVELFLKTAHAAACDTNAVDLWGRAAGVDLGAHDEI